MERRMLHQLLVLVLLSVSFTPTQAGLCKCLCCMGPKCVKKLQGEHKMKNDEGCIREFCNDAHPNMCPMSSLDGVSFNQYISAPDDVYPTPTPTPTPTYEEWVAAFTADLFSGKGQVKEATGDIANRKANLRPYIVDKGKATQSLALEPVPKGKTSFDDVHGLEVNIQGTTKYNKNPEKTGPVPTPIFSDYDKNKHNRMLWRAPELEKELVQAASINYTDLKSEPPMTTNTEYVTRITHDPGVNSTTTDK